MKIKNLETFYKNRKFVIEEDLPEVGVYLYVYEGEKSIADYLQDNIKTCKEFALEKFEVPIDSWVENRKLER